MLACVFPNRKNTPQDWKNTLAVNILGTVTVQCQNEAAIELPSLTSFCSSVEPLSKSSFFQKNRWEQLYKFTDVQPVLQLSSSAFNEALTMQMILTKSLPQHPLMHCWLNRLTLFALQLFTMQDFYQMRPTTDSPAGCCNTVLQTSWMMAEWFCPVMQSAMEYVLLQQYWREALDLLSSNPVSRLNLISVKVAGFLWILFKRLLCDIGSACGKTQSFTLP